MVKELKSKCHPAWSTSRPTPSLSTNHHHPNPWNGTTSGPSFTADPYPGPSTLHVGDYLSSSSWRHISAQRPRIPSPPDFDVSPHSGADIDVSSDSSMNQSQDCTYKRPGQASRVNLDKLEILLGLTTPPASPSSTRATSSPATRPTSSSSANGQSHNQKMLNSPIPAGTPTPRHSPSSSTVPPTPLRGSKSRPNPYCAWCGALGHTKNKCADLTLAIKAGIVFLQKGKLAINVGRTSKSNKETKLETIPYPHGAGTLKEWIERRRREVKGEEQDIKTQPIQETKQPGATIPTVCEASSLPTLLEDTGPGQAEDKLLRVMDIKNDREDELARWKRNSLLLYGNRVPTLDINFTL